MNSKINPGSGLLGDLTQSQIHTSQNTIRISHQSPQMVKSNKTRQTESNISKIQTMNDSTVKASKYSQHICHASRCDGQGNVVNFQGSSISASLGLSQLNDAYRPLNNDSSKKQVVLSKLQQLVNNVTKNQYEDGQLDILQSILTAYTK